MPSQSPFVRQRRPVVAAMVPAVPMALPDPAAAHRAASPDQELETEATAPVAAARPVAAVRPVGKNADAVLPAEATAPQGVHRVAAARPAAATNPRAVRPVAEMPPAVARPAKLRVVHVAHEVPVAAMAQRAAQVPRVARAQRAAPTAHTVWLMHSPLRQPLPHTPDTPIWFLTCPKMPA